MRATIMASKKSRRFRMTGYLLLAVAGVALIIANDLYVYQPWIWTSMAAFMTIGGVVCAFGQWKRVWPPEFVGLPLIWTSLLVFTFLQLSQWDGASGIMLALGVANTSLLLAITILFFARWLDVSAVYHAAKEHADAKR